MNAPKMSFALLIAVLAPLNSARAADVVSTWDGTTNNWSDAAHWNSADFPNNGNGGFTYDAVVNSGTVTLDQGITIDGLTLTNGIINVANDLDLLVDFSWTAGSFRDTGTISYGGSGGTMPTASTKTLDATLAVDGTLDWQLGTLSWSANQGTILVS